MTNDDAQQLPEGAEVIQESLSERMARLGNGLETAQTGSEAMKAYLQEVGARQLAGRTIRQWSTEMAELEKQARDAARVPDLEAEIQKLKDRLAMHGG